MKIFPWRRRSLRGGTFNLKYGRDKKRVLAEVAALFDKHKLDFLCVQEVGDYASTFRADPRFTMIGGAESGIILRAGLKQAKVTQHTFGDGWVTTRGGRYPAAIQFEVLVDGWLYLRSGHWPTPSAWVRGLPVAPAERLDDLIATAKGAVEFFDHPCFIRARLMACDWNEAPETEGLYSPHWVSRKSKATIIAPKSRAGHGRIDYPMVKGARVVDLIKDLEISELSDHEPVVFTVKRGRK